MPYTLLISLGISVLLLFLSLLFRLAGKLRLTLPLVYFLLTATVLNKWAAAHEPLAFAILYALLAFSVLSWLLSLRNALRDRRYYKAIEEDMSWQIKRARKNGIPMDSVYFDSDGNMRYKDTNEDTLLCPFSFTAPSSPAPPGLPSSLPPPVPAY